MVRFKDRTDEVKDDLEEKLSEARNTTVSASLVESSLSDNKLTFSIEADIRELFPELDDDQRYNDISLVELRISTIPDEEFANLEDSTFPEC
ncbi:MULTISPECIES: hypothetical protein [Halorussus]|uniref:hypothetical protein n=1 Tax=Halorussus TaxID=1070314 RepID=UPI00209DB9DF|nr:hypothetical protein [Halorussus vallis]USZ74996.1 hypothetical protein NGM07_16345 [Halorussus vallis]